jgi:hypothetical protein
MAAISRRDSDLQLQGLWKVFRLPSGFQTDSIFVASPTTPQKEERSVESMIGWHTHARTRKDRPDVPHLRLFCASVASSLYDLCSLDLLAVVLDESAFDIFRHSSDNCA